MFSVVLICIVQVCAALNRCCYLVIPCLAQATCSLVLSFVVKILKTFGKRKFLSKRSSQQQNAFSLTAADWSFVSPLHSTRGISSACQPVHPHYLEVRPASKGADRTKMVAVGADHESELDSDFFVGR